jgi:hypothetical protein
MSDSKLAMQHTRTVVLTVVGTKAEALAACEARGLHPVAETAVEDAAGGTCLVESALQESALEYAAKWLWEGYHGPHKVGTLLVIDADVRRPQVWDEISWGTPRPGDGS